MKHVFVETNGTMRLLGEYLRKNLNPDDCLIFGTRTRSSDEVLHLSDYRQSSPTLRAQRYKVRSFIKALQAQIGSDDFELHVAHLAGVFYRVLHDHPKRRQTIFLEEGLVSYGPKKLSIHSFVRQCYLSGLVGTHAALRIGRDYAPMALVNRCVGLTEFSWPQSRNRQIVSPSDVFTNLQESNALLFLMTTSDVPVRQQLSDLEDLRVGVWANRELIVSVHPSMASTGVATIQELLPYARVVAGAERYFKSRLVAGYASSGLLYATTLGATTVTLKSVPSSWPEPLRPTVDLSGVDRRLWPSAIAGY